MKSSDSGATPAGSGSRGCALEPQSVSTAHAAPIPGAEPDIAGQRVLDPCCGSRMFWFDKAHPDVLFGDRRSETITVTDRSHGNASGHRVLRIEPDVLLDFRALPHPGGTFHLVAFDPPHLVRVGPRSWLAAKYGKLGEDWRDDLRAGFSECFRVLKAHGVLVFKWNETQVKVREVLALAGAQPLFGHPSGRKGLTHWYVFMKPKQDDARGIDSGEAGETPKVARPAGQEPDPKGAP